jgi:KDO2-lipid IV(A) lauroyltransferase
MEAALAEGRGVMLVSPHLGCVDLAGAAAAALGWPMTSVAEAVAPRVFAALFRYRTATGLRLRSMRTAAVAVSRALKRGELVAIVADRAIDGPAVEVEFGAGRRMMPTGPAAFALKAGAPIVIAALVRQSNGGAPYVGITRRLEVTSQDAETVTRAIAGVFSEIVMAYPDQWLVFQPGWLPIGAEASGASRAASLAYRTP